MQLGLVWAFWFLFYFSGGLILYFDSALFESFGNVIFMLAVLGLIWNVRRMEQDFMGQLRLVFLSAIGFYAGFVKILGPDIGFSGFGLRVQTFDIGVKMFALTLLAMSGMQLAYGLAETRKTHIRPPLIQSAPKAQLTILHGVSTFFIFLIGYFSALSYGPPIWLAVYASGEGEGQLLGNLQAMGVIFIGLNYLFASKINKRTYWLVSFSSYFYLLVWGILIRGGRLEFLSGIMALFVGYQIIRGRDRRLSIWYYIYLVLAAVLMEYFGYLRSSLSGVDTETMLDGIARMLDEGFLFLGTISGIASSYANVLHMVQNKVIDWQWGIPYFEYLLRTPPDFLYPDRPQDLSAIFDKYGYLSIGGFFELAEEYLNFGLVGVFFIPALITYLFKRIQDKAKAGSLFYYIQLLAIMSVFMRGAWYQTFAYYKAMVTGLIIYGLLCALMASVRPANKVV
jgi:uncharacterized protein (DUF486 family)